MAVTLWKDMMYHLRHTGTPPSIDYTCLNKHRRVLWKTEIFEGPAEKRDSQYQASDVDLE